MEKKIMQNLETVLYRLERLEEKHKNSDDKIDQIMTNHLPHIEKELIRMSTRQNVQTAINVGALIVAVLVTRWLS